jgi:hypothetical protein
MSTVLSRSISLPPELWLTILKHVQRLPYIGHKTLCTCALINRAFPPLVRIVIFSWFTLSFRAPSDEDEENTTRPSRLLPHLLASVFSIPSPGRSKQTRNPDLGKYITEVEISDIPSNFESTLSASARRDFAVAAERRCFVNAQKLALGFVAGYLNGEYRDCTACHEAGLDGPCAGGTGHVPREFQMHRVFTALGKMPKLRSFTVVIE